MNILDKIVLEKTNHTKYLKQKTNKKKYSKYSKSKYFLSAIESNLNINKNALIAEFKRYSPSVKNFNKIKYIQDILEQYHKSKCCCISILTDKNFGGSLNDITIAKKITDKPIIRKDFIINETQVFETKEFGADALLLIAKILSKSNIKKLHNLAINIGLDVLIEIENITEARKIEGIGAKLIGINNRDLKTFRVNLDISIKLASMKTKDIVLISESGIKSGQEIKLLQMAGFDGFLIGSSFMREKDPGKKLNQIIRSSRTYNEVVL